MRFAEGNRGVLFLFCAAVFLSALLVSMAIREQNRERDRERREESLLRKEAAGVAETKPKSEPTRIQEPNTEKPTEIKDKYAPFGSNAIQGEWVNISMEIGGKDQNKGDQSGEMEITSKSLVMKSRAGRTDFIIDLYPDKQSCEIDIRSDGKIVFLGIYKIVGDELKICWRPTKYSCPKHFKTDFETEGVMFTLRRKK